MTQDTIIHQAVMILVVQDTEHTIATLIVAVMARLTATVTAVVAHLQTIAEVVAVIVIPAVVVMGMAVEAEIDVDTTHTPGNLLVC